MSLPCCFTRPDKFIRDEIYTCDNRRMPNLPMCERHMAWTFREAIVDGNLPTDVFMALANYTSQMLSVKRMSREFEMNRAMRSAQRDREEAERVEREARTHVVYYVALTGGRVKIGTTSQLARRLAAYRARGEDLLAVEPGGRTLEHERHVQFAHLRIGRSEDFEFGDDLKAHIDELGRQSA